MPCQWLWRRIYILVVKKTWHRNSLSLNDLQGRGPPRRVTPWYSTSYKAEIKKKKYLRVCEILLSYQHDSSKSYWPTRPYEWNRLTRNARWRATRRLLEPYTRGGAGNARADPRWYGRPRPKLVIGGRWSRSDPDVIVTLTFINHVEKYQHL